MSIGSFFPMLEKGSTRTAIANGCRFLSSLLVVVVCVWGLFGFQGIASAQTTSSVANVSAVATAAGINYTSDLHTIIGRIIYIALSFLGVIFLGILLYAGFLWMTAGGDAEKVQKAQTYIRNAVIGLLIIASAFAITRFILSQLDDVSGQGGINGSGPGRGFGLPSAAGSLGGGIIERHIPARNATDVPRNTAIIIQFKEPILVSSVIKDWTATGTANGLNDDVFKIFPTTSTVSAALHSSDVRVNVTPDHKTFVLRPVSPIGSPTVEMNYTVKILPGATGLMLETGQPAFVGTFSSGYEWSFQVSRVMDVTPPQVQSVVPQSGGLYAPNIVLQITFNEPIDPTTVSSTSIEVNATPLLPAGSPSHRVNGTFVASNNFSTVEFTTDLPCGINTCGRQIYCLPSSSTISVIVHAASLSTTPPQAELTEAGYDGITDVVGNSLDGNGDGIAQGSGSDAVPGDDSYGLSPIWSFGTLDRPNLTPPHIHLTIPQTGNHTEWNAGTHGSSRIPLDQSPLADFDSILQTSTLNSDTALIRNNEPEELHDTFWWTVSHVLLNASGGVATSTDTPVAGRAVIDHRIYLPATSSAPGAPAPEYYPYFYSGIQNIYQNCFNPAASEACPGPNCCDGDYSSTACPYPLTP